MDRTGMDAPLDEIARLETVAADALRPLEEHRVDGWRLRANAGVTRRGNSVLAEAPGERALDLKLGDAEAFYRTRALPSRFQLSPASRPDGIDAALEARGYRHEPGAWVQSTPVATVLAGTASGETGSEGVAVGAEPDPGWLELLAEVMPGAAAQAAGRGAELRSAGLEPGFALAWLDGRPAAVGLAVADGDHAGLFSMATHPELRRLGAGRRVLVGLARWAAGRGVRTLYLQVDARNGGAQAFYERCGFRTRYGYHYRVLDVGGPPNAAPLR